MFLAFSHRYKSFLIIFCLTNVSYFCDIYIDLLEKNHFFENVAQRPTLVRRFYRGVGPALVQGPLARFGDTAANVAVLHFFQKSDLPLPLQTGLASLVSASWRICIMPVDTVKTTLQAEGVKAGKQSSHRLLNFGFSPKFWRSA